MGPLQQAAQNKQVNNRSCLCNFFCVRLHSSAYSLHTCHYTQFNGQSWRTGQHNLQTRTVGIF